MLNKDGFEIVEAQPSLNKDGFPIVDADASGFDFEADAANAFEKYHRDSLIDATSLAVRGGLANIVKSALEVTSALPGQKYVIDPVQRVLGLPTAADVANSWGAAEQAAGQAQAQAALGLDTPVTRFIPKLAGGATSLAPTLIAGPAGVVPMLTAAGLQQGGDTLYNARKAYEEQGITNPQLHALTPALVDAAQTIALTALSGKLFGHGAEAFTLPKEGVRKGAAQLGLNVAKGAAGEVSEEVGNQILSGLIAKSSYNPQAQPLEGLGDTALISLILSGAGEGVNTLAQPKPVQQPVTLLDALRKATGQMPSVTQPQAQTVPVAQPPVVPQHAAPVQTPVQTPVQNSVVAPTTTTTPESMRGVSSDYAQYQQLVARQRQLGTSTEGLQSPEYKANQAKIEELKNKGTGAEKGMPPRMPVQDEEIGTTVPLPANAKEQRFTVRDYLTRLTEDSTSRTAPLAQELLASPDVAALEVKIEYVPDIAPGETDAEGRPYGGEYVVKDDVIRVSHASASDPLLHLHEITHGFTARKLVQELKIVAREEWASQEQKLNWYVVHGKDANVREMSKLFLHARKTFGDKQYGMTDVHEFVAEAFTNKKFQDLLASTPSPVAGISMWQAMLNAIKKMAGRNIKGTMLEDVVKHGAAIVNKQRKPGWSDLVNESNKNEMQQWKPPELGKTWVQGLAAKKLTILLKDYGLSPDASYDEVVQTHKRRRIENHPDRGGSTEVAQAEAALFDEITNRYLKQVARGEREVTPALRPVVEQEITLLKKITEALYKGEEVSSIKDEEGNIYPGVERYRKVKKWSTLDAWQLGLQKALGGESKRLLSPENKPIRPVFDNDIWNSLGFKGKVDAQQLRNRLRNKLGADSLAWKMVEDVLPTSGQIEVSEARQLVEEQKQLENVTYGMEGKVSKATREYDKMTHEWFEQLTNEQKYQFYDFNDDLRGSVYLKQNGWRIEQIKQAQRYKELLAHPDVVYSSRDVSPRATPYYSTVSATKGKRPAWTKSAQEAKAKGEEIPENVQRVDVVLPVKGGKAGISIDGSNTIDPNTGKITGKTLWQPDNLHENLPNTLGWAMIQYKTGPNGEKIAFIAEAQSGWGQTMRELKQREASGERGFATAEENQRIINKQDHPLLRDYNRLILKAAIEQAHKEGATHIVISDKYSALLTEGLDNQSSYKGPFETKEIAEHEASKNAGWHVFDHSYKDQKTNKQKNRWYISDKESGFAFNYDTSLPRIAEDLTGSKGERVSLGEHKNAFEVKHSHTAAEQLNPRVKDVITKKPRSNLIFRNPDGTPKTDVSGLMYPLAEVSKRLAEKGPFTQTGRMFGHVGSDKVPDFLPINEAMATYPQRQGIEKIPGLRYLWGTAGRFVENPITRAVLTWYTERHGVVKAFVNDVAIGYEGKINKVFKATSQGDLNVQPTQAGQSLKISDVFEALRTDINAYNLTPQQKHVFITIVRPILDRVSRLADKYNIVQSMNDDLNYRSYFPRVVLESDSLTKPNKGMGGGVGIKRFRDRVYRTEAEGWAEGTRYATDVEARLTDGLERLYTSIADKRLATNTALGGQTLGQLRKAINVHYNAAVAAGAMTRAEVNAIIRSRQLKGQVAGAAFAGKIFTPEVAQLLKQEFRAEANPLHAVAWGNALLKTMTLGFDFGVGFIQLQMLGFSNPKIWAQTNLKALQSFAQKSAFVNYVDNNSDVVRELAELGSPVGELIEHMKGLERGGALQGALKKVPKVGKALAEVPASFARQFQTAMDVAKIELYKANKTAGMDKQSAYALIRTIENVLAFGRTESAGQKHSRSVIERVVLLAPAYYRGALELTGHLGDNGASGKVARRALGAYAAGGLLLFGALAKAFDMPDEELKARLNPTKAEFMTLPVTLPNGNKMEVGFGGLWLSLVRLVGKMTDKAATNPKDFLTLRSDKNPLTAWLRGHAGPLPAIGWTMATGYDFSGEPRNLTDTPRYGLPLAFGSDNTKSEMGPSMLGLRAREKTRLTTDEVSKQLFGLGYEKLDLAQRAEVTQKVSEQPRKTLEDQYKSTKWMQEQMFENMAELRNTLPKEQKKWLNDQGLQLRQWSERFVLEGSPITLTSAERKTYREGIAQAYQEAITYAREDKEKWTQEKFDALLAEFRKQAKAQFVQTLVR